MSSDLDSDSVTIDDNHELPEAKVFSSSATGSGLKRMALNDTKAGMEGLDVDKINQIIEEASKGSKFYLHQQKEQEKLNIRIHGIRELHNNLKEEQIQKSTSTMDKIAAEMEFKRVLNRVIIHVDMDAYYAAVEMRDNPALSDVPMAVGGDSMLSTSNYLARKFGVRAGMPGFIARKLCPNLVIVPTNYKKYGEVSKDIQEIFQQYDPNFCSVSLDEAYLDVTDYLNSLNSSTAEEVTKEIRDKIYLRTQLTASAGIACNSLLAKICGDLNKPNGQYYLKPTIDVIKEFIVKLPIRKVSGIGNVTEQLLNSLNIFTCGDLWTNRGIINLLFKPATVSFLLAVSLGIGNSWFSSSDTTEHQKSISSERTFSGSGNNIEPELCHSLCLDLERELISKELKAQTVTLKIKTIDFQVKTRAVRLLTPTNEADIIFETAWSIYKSYLNDIKGLEIRLLGVRLSSFQSSTGEISETDNTTGTILSTKPKKQERIDHLLSKLKPKDLTDASFECPICCNKFFIYNQLEIHVEKCLSSSNQPSEQTCVDINTSSASSSNSVTKCYTSSEENTFNLASSSSHLSANTDSIGAFKIPNKNKRRGPTNNSPDDGKRRKNRISDRNRKITDYAIFESSPYLVPDFKVDYL